MSAKHPLNPVSPKMPGNIPASRQGSAVSTSRQPSLVRGGPQSQGHQVPHPKTMTRVSRQGSPAGHPQSARQHQPVYPQQPPQNLRTKAPPVQAQPIPTHSHTPTQHPHTPLRRQSGDAPYMRTHTHTYSDQLSSSASSTGTDLDLMEMKGERSRLLSEIHAIQEQLTRAEETGRAEDMGALRSRLALLRQSLQALLGDMEIRKKSPWRRRWRREGIEPGRGHGEVYDRRYDGGMAGPHEQPYVADVVGSSYAERQGFAHSRAVESLLERQQREARGLQIAFEEKAREMEVHHREQKMAQAAQMKREQENLLAYERALAAAEAAKRNLELASQDLRNYEQHWIASSTMYRPSMGMPSPGYSQRGYAQSARSSVSPMLP